MKRNGSEKVVVRGFSSVGRALALQARGHRFEPVNLHQTQGRAVGKKRKKFFARSEEDVEKSE